MLQPRLSWQVSATNQSDLYVTSGVSGDTLNLAYQSGLERIAAESGGAAVWCRTTDEIRPALTALLNRIRSGYVVTVDAPNSKRQSLKVRIAAQDAEGKSLDRITHPNSLTIRKK